MKTVRLSPRAELELLGAIQWYEEQRPGLGAAFYDEVLATLDRIAANPAQFPVVDDPTRRTLLVRFPYGLFFEEMDDQLVVMAVFHLHRDPNTLDD